MDEPAEAKERVRAGLATIILDYIDFEGITTTSSTAKKLGLPKKVILTVSQELEKKGFIQIESRFLRDTRLIRRPRASAGPRSDHETKIIAISNQKGGVGKTTTSINLAAALAEVGAKTLLIDLDSQANATSGLGFDKHKLEKSIYDTLVEYTPLKDIIIHTKQEKLDLAPANVDLAGVEVEFVNLPERETRLKRAIDAVASQYDVILIDCPPSLGLLTINGLTGADSVLVPVQCDYYALEGISQLLLTIELVKERLNPKMHVEGVLLTMYDPKTKLSVQIADEVKSYFGDTVYKSIIPRNVKLSEAASHGKTILDYDKSSAGAKAYMKLAMEVLSDD